MTDALRENVVQLHGSFPDHPVDSYLRRPWNPFSRAEQPITREMLPARRLMDPDLPVGLFILAALLHESRFARPDVRRGWQFLAELHKELPLSGLTSFVVEQDKEEITARAIEEAERRFERALGRPDSLQRQRMIERAQAALDRNGGGQWNTYLSSIRALRAFAGSLGLRDSELPPMGLDDMFVALDRGEAARRAMSEAELELARSAAKTTRDPELAALVMDLIRETAARRTAVIDLTVDDIHWGDSTVTLHTKNKVVHRAVVSGDLLERIAVRAIEQGWDGHQRSVRPNRWQPNPSRAALRRACGRPLTDRWFDALHSSIDRACGKDLGFRFTVHWLRHTTIAQVERIAGPDVARQWAAHREGGHGPARGNATAHYTRWESREMKWLFREMFPKTPPGAVDPASLAEKLQYGREHNITW